MPKAGMADRHGMLSATDGSLMSASADLGSEATPGLSGHRRRIARRWHGIDEGENKAKDGKEVNRL